MKKTAKTAFVMVLAVVALLGILSVSSPRYLDGENYSWNRTANDFYLLEGSVKWRLAEDKDPLQTIGKIQSVDELIALLGSKLDVPGFTRLDARGQPIQFSRQEHEDRVVLTLSSNIPYKKDWPWQKDRPLALEITVYRDREKAFEIKQLWRSE